MNQHHIRNNATTFQLPFISSTNHKSPIISNIRSNENQNKIRNTKTQPTIEKLEQLPYLKLPKDNKYNNKISNHQIHTNNFFLSKINENKNNNSLSWSNIEYKKLILNNLAEYYTPKKICRAFKPSKFPVDDRNIISIRIESNWENTSKIMMYFIALFDKSNRQIISKNKEQDDLLYITSFPEPSSLIKLDNLLDSSYINNDQSNFFCEFFGDQKFTIYISIPRSIEVRSILIFNPPTKSESAVKDVSILVNEELCIQGQIPQDFGLSLKFDNFTFQTKENDKQKNKENCQKKHCSIPKAITYRDDFGILPIKPVGQIKIEILETYICPIKIQSKENVSTKIKYCDENYIGVNGFDFYDILGNLISNQSGKSTENCLHYINEVKIRGISELIHFGMLLKEDKLTNNKDKMLLGLMDHTQYPSFNFTFNQPIYLSKILIWNFNSFSENLNCGIKKLKVYIDNKLFWFGKIFRGNGKDKDCIFHSIKLFQPNSNISEIKI